MLDTSIPFLTLLERLSAIRPFSCLSTPQLAHAIRAACVKAAPAGRTLIGEGEGACDYLVLLEGELEVRRRYLNADGQMEWEIGRLRAGEGAGEMTLLHRVSRQACVRALCASRYLRMDGERMEELLAWSQRFAHELNDLAGLRARMSLVHQIGPFRHLPLENVLRAFEALQPKAVECDTMVVCQGETGDVYYLIERGLAEVWRTDPMSGESARVAVLGPGEAFGEEALLLGGVRHASVKMVTPGWLWTLSKADFDALVKPALIEEISLSQAQEMARRHEVRWLDCRHDVEFDGTRLPRAIHAPLDRLRELAGTLDKKPSYIVYCHGGRRSACAAYLLRERGFLAYSLAGGIRDWPFAVERATASGMAGGASV